jgi:dihydropteroate synthase/2-amino-4-hydroxy-6-hydroxymethyldihydropteridine diphosphokinase
MPQVYLGLGSNIGDRAAYLAFARQHFSVTAASALYESPAMLPPGAPVNWNRPYLNQVIAIQTTLAPETLLAEVKQVEQAAGRRDRGSWAPRELDIDVLAYEGVAQHTGHLTLPHPGINMRDFVLLPLRDIAPDWPDIDAKIAALPVIVATRWQSRTEIMGILNITPDSFSDGGKMDLVSVLAAFESLVKDGADIIDIGAESTRPGATPLTADEEWVRLEAPLRAIFQHPFRARVTLSLDTRHATTAARALEMGIDIINDVSGLRDPAMRILLRDALCDVVVMHSLTIPADKTITLPENTDPVMALLAWKSALETCGIPPERLIYDPGIGFGKTAPQSRALIDRAGELSASGGRWLFGHSRKSFLEMPMEKRDAATVALSRQLAAQGIAILRVHDVKGHQSL